MEKKRENLQKKKDKKNGVRRYARYVTDASRPFQLALDIDGVRTMKEEEKRRQRRKETFRLAVKRRQEREKNLNDKKERGKDFGTISSIENPCHVPTF